MLVVEKAKDKCSLASDGVSGPRDPEPPGWGLGSTTGRCSRGGLQVPQGRVLGLPPALGFCLYLLSLYLSPPPRLARETWVLPWSPTKPHAEGVQSVAPFTEGNVDGDEAKGRRLQVEHKTAVLPTPSAPGSRGFQLATASHVAPDFPTPCSLFSSSNSSQHFPMRISGVSC